MIRNVYMPMERSRGNVYAMLQNYAKTLKNSVDQVTGSRAIQIPEFIEPDEEKALADTNTIQEYEEYLVRLPTFLFSQHHFLGGVNFSVSYNLKALERFIKLNV